MSDFALYFQLGVEHIADLQAYDHMLFIIALCVIFKLRDWRKVLVLVTAFTVGHSVTLALSVLDLINIDKNLVETLIPITILSTCLVNIFLQKPSSIMSLRMHYILALFFGLIHGLGFANYLKTLLMGMQSLTWPLLSFNLGIEAGQIIIVITYLLIYALLEKLTNLSHKIWVIAISAIVGLISIYLLF